MRKVLRLHPDSRCFAAAHVEVEVARLRTDSLALSYVVTGKMSDIRMPPVVAIARSDELWRHTCFEAFVRGSSCVEYYEFNFAPSIEVQLSPHSYTLQVSLGLDRLSDLPCNASWRLGLSALIEDTSGRKSYWALVHPPGKPDFHHTDSFAHEISPVMPP